MATVKKITAILLCFVLLFAFAAACAKKEKVDQSAREETKDNGQIEKTVQETDFGKDRMEVYRKGFDAHRADEIVLTVGGREVCWQEFYYWLLVSIEYFVENYGEIENWNANDGDVSVKDYVLRETVDILKLHRSVEEKADELNVEIGAADREYLETTKADVIEQYGGREAFEAELEANFMSEEVYDRQNEIAILYYNVFAKLYGENGELASDEETADFAESIGYMRVKHIMLAKLNEDGTVLDAETLKEKLETAETVLQEILDTPENERERVFDEKMHAYSEDPDMEIYPDGYSFVAGSGELIEELDMAAAELPEGEVAAKIIESEQGFHIVMRLGVLPDTMVDEYYSLRYYAAYQNFENMAAQWQKEMKTEFSELYTSLDFEELFPEMY